MYTCLLCDLAIEQSSQIWCADVTATPMRRRFLCLVCIMDRASRKILAWRLLNSLDAEFCVVTLEAVLALYGRPEIFTDQGSQVTSLGFTERLKASGVCISMDGQGRCMDNVFIGRLWRSPKYEYISLHTVEIGSDARVGIED